MNEKILDAPFEEIPKLRFEDYFEEGENILWIGHPKQNWPFTYGFGIAILITCAFIIINPLPFLLFGKWGHFIVIPTILVLHIILTIRKNKKKKKTIYAITEKRVFFQLVKNLKRKIHFIPFSQINNVIVIEHNLYQSFNQDYGVIYFSVKRPELVPFTTYNFEIHEKRHQPTFELIEKPEAIANLIRKGIKNVNKR